MRKIPEKSVLVITSKIVALSEGRFVRKTSFLQKEKLIQKESKKSLRTKQAWLTMKDGMMMANAGIDESNADGKLILLPRNSFTSAEKLRKELKHTYRVKKFGVIISDSHIAPLRAGVTAHALGYAGIKGVCDYRGTKDIFGRKMRISRTNVADSLATAAALIMGEGAERQPLALITGAPVTFSEKTDPKEMKISIFDDIYGPLLKEMKKKGVAPRGIEPRSRA
ncbi:coenzyme F420-0:L-glutamate ligase [Candidatus Kaiserbacteria bacterium]|nr:coenzyme F420-0:L-glutamate ligase [Candidatus Kaiserbacteria bacterium]